MRTSRFDIAALLVPASCAGRVRHFSLSKHTAKTSKII